MNFIITYDAGKRQGQNLPPVKNSPRRIQHIFNENPIPSRRIIHKNVRHRADELAVLDDRAAAHE